MSLWEVFPLFSEFTKDCYFFFKQLMKFTSETTKAWAFFCGAIFFFFSFVMLGIEPRAL
jgi:multidrug transporter EmrE-like cation transporter